MAVSPSVRRGPGTARAALTVVGVGVALLVARAVDAQQREEVLRGRVLAADGTPLAEAQVTARSARSLRTRAGQTHADGRFVLVFPDSSSAYELLVTRIAFRPDRRRVTRGAGEPWPSLDIVLEPAAVELPEVTAQAARPRVSFIAGTEHNGIAGGERATDFLDVPLDQLGAFDAIGTLAPDAVALTGAAGNPSGFSVAGVPAGGNSVTVDGTPYAGPNLPIHALGGSQVVTNTYRGSRGSFSGGQVRATLGRGNGDPGGGLFLRFSDPALQAAGPVGSALGRERRDVAASAGWAGQLTQLFNYQLAAGFQHQTSPLVTLTGAGRDALVGAGLAPDSIARLRDALAALDVPLTAPRVPSAVATSNVVGSAHLTSDHVVRGFVLGLWLHGDRSESAAQGLGITAVPTAGARTVSDGGGVKLSVARTAADGFLHESSTYLSRRGTRSVGYLDLPSGVVRVPSSLPDGDGTVANLRFGGSDASARASTTTWDSRHTTQWHTPHRRHLYEIGVESAFEWFERQQAPNRFGTFTFNSLADLEAGRPASFARTLGDRHNGAHAWRGALSFGDVAWQVGRSLQLTYSLRLEGARIGGLGPADRAVDSLFGVRSAAFPGDLALVPRLGFTWRPGSQLRSPYGTLSGGIARLRSAVAPAEVAFAGGRASELPVLSCVGDAAPIPDWAAYRDDPASIPTDCRAGLPPGTAPVAGAVPDVAVFDRSYGPSGDWRAHLRWSGRLPALFSLSVDARYSLGTSDPSALDLNFDPTPRFQLADEAGRPVFAPPEAFTPAGGAVSLLASRRVAGYGQVTSYRSDARRHAWSLSVTLRPKHPDYNRPLYELGYTYSRIRGEARGSDDVTGGDPTVLSASRSGAERRHQMVVRAMVPFGDLARLQLIGRLASGAPFTPRVDGDVNGDGLWNDAAFVFDPAAVADPALADGMRRLLRDAPRGTRACLARQVGRIAARNSCTGPWSGNLDAVLTVPLRNGGLGGLSGSVSLIASNVLGGVDQLLHGAGHLKGWGGAAPVDPALLSMRGFDPATQRFAYDVNPRFGASVPGQAALRTPFRLALALTLDLRPQVPKRVVGELRDAVRAAATGDSSRLGPVLTGIDDPYALFLDVHRDEFLLTAGQVQALDSLRAAYRRAHALVAGGVRALAHPDSLAGPWREVYRRLEPIERAKERLYRQQALLIRAVLAPDQWELAGDILQEAARAAEREARGGA